MSKKLVTLVLVAVSAAAFALPATASALEPLHISGSIPVGGLNGTIAGGEAKLSTTAGLTVSCNSVSGNANFSTTTKGTMELTFTGDCRENVFNSTCNSAGKAGGTITTETLPFELATIKRVAPGIDETKIPGVLVTPVETGGSGTKTFAQFICAGGLVTTTVEGNGVIGRIESPNCGGSSATPKIVFEVTSHGQQTYKTLEGTQTEYDLLSNGNTTAAQDATGTLTLPEARTLECT